MTTMTKTRCLLLAAAAAMACGVPTTATAATIGYDGTGTLTFTAAPGEKNYFGVYAGEPGRINISDSGVSGLTYPADLCSPGYVDYEVECPLPAALSVSLGDGDDIANGPDDEVGVPATIDGGAGADVLRAEVFSTLPSRLVGAAGNDKLTGGGGVDVLDGGDGADELNGRDDRDQVLGGPGSDKLQGDGHNVDPAADLIDGGDGYDVIESEWSGPSEPGDPVSVTLAGGADDGRPGEGDEVRGVEKLDLFVPGVFTGTEGPDYIDVHQREESSRFIGLGGDDRLEGSDGDDQLDGGAGADLLDGGYGHDRITGGPGADVIHGDVAGGECGIVYCKLPYGNDTIEARDGAADQVDCGVGADVVNADPGDTVAPDCETVNRGGGGDRPAGSPLQMTFAKTSLRTALKKGLKVQVATPRSGLVKLAGKRSSKVLARGAAVVPGGLTTVRLEFTRAARRSLARARRARLAVTLIFTAADGTAAKVNQFLTLKR